MGETRPGGATRTIPKEHRGAHGNTATAEPLTFGRVPEKKSRTTEARRQIQETVASLDIVPPPQPEPQRPALKPGDPVDLYPTIVTFEEFLPRRYREAGTIETAGKYELVKIHRLQGKPLYELKPMSPTGPIVRSVFIKPVGPGKGWVTATRAK